MSSPRKRVGCPLCGGQVRPVAGLLTCEKCGHRPRPSEAFRRQHDVPRDSGMKRPLVDEE